MPIGTLRASESLWKWQGKSVTSMQAQGVVAPPGLTQVGCLSAPPGLCQGPRLTQVTPVHFTSHANESQTQNLHSASWPCITRNSGQSQTASRLPQKLQRSNLVPASRSSVALQPCQSQPISGSLGSLLSAVGPPVPQQAGEFSSQLWSAVPDCDSQLMDAKLSNSASTTASRLSSSQLPSNISELSTGASMVNTTMLCNSPSYSGSDRATITSRGNAMTSRLMQTMGQNSAPVSATPITDTYNRGDYWSKASTCERLATRARLEPATEFFCDNSWSLTV